LVSNKFKFDNYKEIGLKNIGENLPLIYPHKHQFLIENNKNVFSVNLTIDLKK
jgi:hypothetical protein|tara:strand:+ start:3671 stop:3829 length:159 start_codon:yes stop_codon:yes gene_type:complete